MAETRFVSPPGALGGGGGPRCQGAFYPLTLSFPTLSKKGLGVSCLSSPSTCGRLLLMLGTIVWDFGFGGFFDRFGGSCSWEVLRTLGGPLWLSLWGFSVGFFGFFPACHLCQPGSGHLFFSLSACACGWWFRSPGWIQVSTYRMAT